MKDEGVNAFYKSLVPLWMRQIPYTMMKFACFEKTIELLYKYVVPKPRDQCTKGEQLVVTFAAGYIAGVFCAIVSHPADTVVSKLNQNKESTAIQVAKDLGFMGKERLWPKYNPQVLNLNFFFFPRLVERFRTQDHHDRYLDRGSMVHLWCSESIPPSSATSTTGNAGISKEEIGSCWKALKQILVTKFEENIR